MPHFVSLELPQDGEATICAHSMYDTIESQQFIDAPLCLRFLDKTKYVGA